MPRRNLTRDSLRWWYVLMRVQLQETRGVAERPQAQRQAERARHLPVGGKVVAVCRRCRDRGACSLQRMVRRFRLHWLLLLLRPALGGWSAGSAMTAAQAKVVNVVGLDDRRE